MKTFPLPLPVPLPLTALRHLAAAACTVFLAFVSVLRVRTFADRTGALAVLGIVVLAAGCDVTPTTVAVDEETTYATRKPVTIVTEWGSTCTVLPQRNPEITTAECRIVAAPTSAETSDEVAGQGLFGGVIVVMAVGTIKSFMDYLEGEPRWYRLAKMSCGHTSRRLGWFMYRVHIESTMTETLPSGDVWRWVLADEKPSGHPGGLPAAGDLNG